MSNVNLINQSVEKLKRNVWEFIKEQIWEELKWLVDCQEHNQQIILLISESFQSVSFWGKNSEKCQKWSCSYFSKEKIFCFSLYSSL